jgi:hypothetical protein
MASRSLSERLQAFRSERPLSPPTPARSDHSAVLARWFGARTEVADGGASLVVERRVTLPAAAAARLAALPPATYFDTETTGLSTGAGTVIFLAGLARRDGESLVVRQHLLPDYPHERPLLGLVARDLAALPRLVTYNGRTFDLPLLVTRLTVHRLFAAQAALPATHDDLLPVARRLWRRPLGGARLAVIEAGVLGVRRSSDCPSSEVPARYFSFLRTGTADLLAEVLDHNLQDVVSLALLEAELVRLREGGWRTAAPLDPRGMALDLLRAGAIDDALQLLEVAIERGAEPEEAHALRRLATRLLIGSGEVDRAEGLWRVGTRRASVDAAAAWIEVARIRERHRADLAGALEAVAAASRILDLAFALGIGGSMDAIGRTRLKIDSRLRRLRRWTAAAERRAARQRVA